MAIVALRRPERAIILTMDSIRHYLPSNPARRRDGFTLIELMLVFALMMLLAAMVYPSWAGWAQTNDLTQAKGHAALLCTAKSIYVREQGAAAVQAWSTGGDSDRFLLLRSYLGASAAQATLATYFPSGYSVTMGNLDDGVTLWQGTTQISYIQ